MRIPSTSQEFLALVQHSDLVEQARLDRHLQQMGAVPADAQDMAACLVRIGMLTQFQADHLLQGKWRGFTLGRYKVLRPIGSGGMGMVYLCEHKFMHRLVAVKVLPLSRSKNDADRERFYREARAVAALDHPNIVRAYDINQEGDLHFLVMEYVEGDSLQQLVHRQGPLSPRRTAHFLRQAALGLHHAFAAGLVHRDVKPANVLVDPSSVLKLLDLGLARFFADEEDDLSIRNDDTVLGTADFVAPEQSLDARRATTRSDIYSLGATIYYCLTGQPPYPGGNIASKLARLNSSLQPRPIRSFRNDVPADFLALVEKMMAKTEADRFETPADVAEAVASLPLLGGDAVSLDTLVMKSDSTLRENAKKKTRATNWAPWLIGGIVAGVLLLYLLAWLAVK